jgi:hypothetical protein
VLNANASLELLALTVDRSLDAMEFQDLQQQPFHKQTSATSVEETEPHVWDVIEFLLDSNWIDAECVEEMDLLAMISVHTTVAKNASWPLNRTASGAHQTANAIRDLKQTRLVASPRDRRESSVKFLWTFQLKLQLVSVPVLWLSSSSER